LGDALAFLSKARKFATTIKMASLSQLARRHTTRHLIEEARVVLVYVGIFATFAVVTSIACIAWLLVW
jgi:hypothetical protein